MSSPPTGTVTFLFTDIEGSTKRWERYPRQMQAAVERHDALLRHSIEANGGYVFKTVGDAFCAAFSTPQDTLQAALDAQRALNAVQWAEEIGSVRVRMALHTGIAQERDGDYFGQPVNRVARLLSAGHGGQILFSLSTCELVRDHLPPGVELLDFGERRLKDLIRPERVFQLVAPDLPAEFPPIKTLDARPNNLPVQTTPLIGREKELGAVLKLLADEDTHLVTLTGPGGVGKTRLGLQVAADVIDEFDDGVIFVALAPIIEPELVVSTIAQAMGVKEAPGQPLIDTLKEFLRDRQMLLVLDNFEQVVEAAPAVSELIVAVPRLKVLATSRERLRLRGEHEFPVPPLALPDREHPPPIEQLSQYEAVRLFIERAVAVKPDFAVTNDNLPSVAEICHRLDGLPLAIELAAARIKVLPPQIMLVRLESRLKVATGGARDLPARQQTLRNTIEWSYDLLDEGEKQLFRRMAVFQGGTALEALEAVCNHDGELQVEVLEGAESLLNKSLLQQRNGGDGSDGEPRFWMLETIHEYAREKLGESGEVAALGKEHAHYFMRLAEEAEPHLTGAKQVEWLNRLEDEHDNIRAALQWASEGAEAEAGGKEAVEAGEVGLRIAGAIYHFWFVKGLFTEGREHLRRTLSMPHSVLQACSLSSRAKALNGAGLLAWRQGDYSSARSLLEHGLALAREVGDMKSVAVALNNLGNVAQERGDLAGARALYEEGLAVARALGDRYRIAVVLGNLGGEAHGQGDLATAYCLHKESLDIKRELGDILAIAGSLTNLGAVIQEQGDYRQAYALYEESLALRRELGDRGGIAASLGLLGHLALEQGDYRRASSLYEDGLTLFREMGDKKGAAACLVGLGGVLIGVTNALATAGGEAERGVRVLGAVDGLMQSMGAVLDREERLLYDRVIQQARARLGEEAFERAWAEGRAMSMEQAIEYALQDTGERR